MQSAAVKRVTLRERTKEISEEKPGLSPFCLFIHLFLQNLSPLSKVRGTAKECVSSKQRKTNTQLTQCRRDHSPFSSYPDSTQLS